MVVICRIASRRSSRKRGENELVDADDSGVVGAECPGGVGELVEE